MKTTQSKATRTKPVKLSATQTEDARIAAEAGAEAGRDFALTLDDEEMAFEQIRSEARLRVAGTGMFEHEWKAYVAAFVAAAEEAIGV